MGRKNNHAACTKKVAVFTFPKAKKTNQNRKRKSKIRKNFNLETSRR